MSGISHIAHKYGTVKVFRAYLDIADNTSLRFLEIKATLQRCGVTLVNCPHNRRKEVADKMLMGKWLCGRRSGPSLTVSP